MPSKRVDGKEHWYTVLLLDMPKLKAMSEEDRKEYIDTELQSAHYDLKMELYEELETNND